jgi:uncharacterized repeat protein (TIGR03803 family)
VLHSFASPPRGANPFSGVIRDSAGNLYGTTSAGGTADQGVVFKVDTAGRQSVLYNFTGGADGGSPNAGVIRDSAGNLYGTTGFGGTAGMGVAFKVAANGQETVLHSFTGGADGADPSSGLILDSAGNLYGTTASGGIGLGAGVVYELETTGQLTVLYSFRGGADGSGPSAGVIRDAAGNLYGTTDGGGIGGIAGDGVVFKLDPTGHETVLYSFAGADGGESNSGVIRDAEGNFYGTTFHSGSANSGIVYKLDTAGQETVLYSFTGGADGGGLPSGVIRDAAGNLYGTTSAGGVSNAGVVYDLDTSGQETVLYSFTGGADGSGPWAGVIRDAAGNLYGTTLYGGTGQGYSGIGVVFEVDTTNQEAVLYAFPGGADGSGPSAGVIEDAAGDLYGITGYGGTANAGVVYKLDASGRETTLYSFTGGADGGNPSGGVIRDSAGNLYGTTLYGGTANYGVVYKLDTAGHESVLYSFPGGSDGALPLAGVIRDAAGNLYGTTFSGGPADWGVVFKLDTAGNETVLFGFTGGADGGHPIAGVVRDSAGSLYGTTYNGGTANAGVVYKLGAEGRETVLYRFTGGADGNHPYAGVIRDATGNLYGTTYYGGTGYGNGVVYKLDTAGGEAVLYSFTGGADGRYPQAGVIRDSAGNFYGTTIQGGTDFGVVFKLDTAGQETVLYAFTGDGGLTPSGGVIRDSAGNLYGTTGQGGTANRGVVFQLAPE